jgi:hypothetical protein
MAAGIKGIAQNLQAMGRNGDSILAHIMPEEAAMLKRMGGAGTINPKTGLPEFYFGDISSYGGSSPGGSISSGRDSSSSNQSPSYGGGSASWSGGGRDSSSSNQSPTYSSGGGRDSSSSNQSPSYTGGDGGGFNSANFGVGGGMLTPSNPSMSFSGGGGGGFGVPTIISNAASSIGQSLFNFSDTSTALIRDVYNNPSNYIPSFGSPNQAGYFGDIPSSVGQLPGTPNASGVVMNPRTTPVMSQEEQRAAYANAAGDIYFLSQGPQVSSRQWNTEPIEVPPAPTSTTNAYNFVPNYEGLPQEEAALQQRMRTTRLMEGFDTAFPPPNAPRQLPSFPAVPDAAELYGVDTSAGIASLQRPMSMPEIRPTMSLLADRLPNAPGVEETAAPQPTPQPAPQPAPLGSSLEELMGTVPAGNPMFPSMAFRQAVPTVAIGGQQVPSTFNVNVPNFLVDTRKTQWGSGFYPKDPDLYSAVTTTLPSKGVVFKPGSQMTELGIPAAGSAVYTGVPFGEGVTEEQIKAAQEFLKTEEALGGYNKFMTDYGSSLTPRSVTRTTFDMTQPGSQAIPDVSGGVGPQGFGDVPLSFESPAEVGGAVATTLDTYFNELSKAQTGVAPRNTYFDEVSKAQTGQAPRPSVPAQEPTRIDGVPIYAEARPFSGPQSRIALSNEARYAGGGIFSDIEELNDLPAGYLGKLYGIESTFGTNLVAKDSSARGPFQFTDSTGQQYGLRGPGFDNRMDLLQSAAAAGSLAVDNRASLARTLGRQPSAGELYLAHQQGIGGAKALLRNPDRSAFDALKVAYEGNEKKALAALVNNGGNLNMSAAEFANKWISRMERAAVSPPGGYGGPAPLPRRRSEAPAVAPTAAQVAQNPQATGNFLDAQFEAVLAMTGAGQADLADASAVPSGFNVFEDTGALPARTGGDGRPNYNPRRDVVEQAPVTETPVTPPRLTTGMDLTRQAYTPRGLATTRSPVYS